MEDGKHAAGGNLYVEAYYALKPTKKEIEIFGHLHGVITHECFGSVFTVRVLLLGIDNLIQELYNFSHVRTPLRGSARRIGDNEMTTANASIAAQLAAQIAGPATGDPDRDAGRNAFIAAANDLGEMQQLGFTTAIPFANVNQPRYVEGQEPFLLVSRSSGTTYFVVVKECVGDRVYVYINVNHEGQVPNQFRKMTLTRGVDGTTVALPGW